MQDGQTHICFCSFHKENVRKKHVYAKKREVRRVPNTTNHRYLKAAAKRLQTHDEMNESRLLGQIKRHIFWIPIVLFALAHNQPEEA